MTVTPIPSGDETDAITSVTLADLRLSLRAPVQGWRGEAIDSNMFRLFGPEQPDLGDYSPTMSFKIGEPEGFGAEWFDEFTVRAVADMEAGYENFWLNRQERFTLSSMVDVHAVWFEWIHGESGMHFVQLQAYIPASPFEMYLVNAATLKRIEDEFVPIFDNILRSVRILKD